VTLGVTFAFARRGISSYVYDAENRLVSRSGGVALAYDPNGRLFQTSGGTAGVTQFLYDGDALVGEYDGAGNLLRRYVHGADAAADDPLLWYEGAGLGLRHSLFADHQGSIVAASDNSGASVGTNAYDAWGVPNSTSVTTVGRFGYTGQAWLPDLGMWYYKARIYSPTLGRFLQTDPVGYGAGMNDYSYVGSDPSNARDPTGNVNCGLESNWRSGNCADTAVEDQISEFGHEKGASSSSIRFAVGQVLDLLHGRIDMAEFMTNYQIHDFKTGLNLESPLPRGAAKLEPLSELERRQVLALLGTASMKDKMTQAWRATLANGHEHGFFIQLSINQSTWVFRIGDVMEGTDHNMGKDFALMAHLLSQFFAAFHTHPGAYEAAGFASVGDQTFDKHYGSISIIQTRWGLIYGH
jgi:RHS repeat-associated protein